MFGNVDLRSNYVKSICNKYLFGRGNLQDLTIPLKYLIALTVGYDQKQNFDKAMKKVSYFSFVFHVCLSVNSLDISVK